MSDPNVADLSRSNGMTVRRVAISKVVEGDNSLQAELKGRTGEGWPAEQIQVVQQAGSYGNMPAEDGVAIVVFPDGEGGQGYVIAADNKKHRPKWGEGAGGVYALDGSLAIVRVVGGVVTIESDAKVEVKAPDVTVEASATASVKAPTITAEGDDVSVIAGQTTVQGGRIDLNGQVYINGILQVGN